MGASHCFDGCTDARIRVPQKGIKVEEKGAVGFEEGKLPFCWRPTPPPPPLLDIHFDRNTLPTVFTFSGVSST